MDRDDVRFVAETCRHLSDFFRTPLSSQGCLFLINWAADFSLARNFIRYATEE